MHDTLSLTIQDHRYTVARLHVLTQVPDLFQRREHIVPAEPPDHARHMALCASPCHHYCQLYTSFRNWFHEGIKHRA